jgi:hypothetical protein
MISMEQISIGNLHELINRPEITELISMTEDFQKKYEDNYCVQNRILENFNGIVQFLIENPDKPIDIFLVNEPAQTTQFTAPITAQTPTAVTQLIQNAIMYLHINKDGFYLKDKNSQWGVNRFEYFTPSEGLKSGYNSFLKAIFGYPNVYEQLYPKLSENGKELFSKLKVKYNSLYFNQIENKWANYKITNLSEDEKKILNFSTENASLTFHTRRSDVNIFIGNEKSPKGTPRPIFNHAIFDKRRGDREQFVYEKIFIINHYGDIRRGFDMYKTYELPKVDSHLEFIIGVNEMISKFVILKKL